jgi:predicted SAM-dependent methyltransferase
MNLLEFDARKIAGFAFNGTTPATRTVLGHAMLGLEIAPAEAPQIIIKDVFGQRPLRSFPSLPGWVAVGEKNSKLMLTLRDGQTILAQTHHEGDAPWEVELPWPSLQASTVLNAALEIHVTGAPVFIAVSRTLDRADIINACKGKGVEIGPGVTPQIFSNNDIDVVYAEEKAREDWLKTYAYKLDKYKTNIDKLPWDRYHTKPAFDLPADDASLDFIFASHVLEHLVNPLGHLEHWMKKLKPGGKVIGILPHCENSGDYQRLPSMLPTIALEYQRKETQPNLNHYRAIFGKDAEVEMAAGRTLHVHFYNEKNLQDFFSYAAGMLPIAGFRIVAERNYREFFFTVQKR